ncbi:MAG TPA: M48 family metallopeptidase [Acidimicrobiales bacterium]|nr:M48 family metallopeptidase [Acidimicrobiales bacterium]
MFDQVTSNKRRSALLIAAFVLLVVAVAWAFDQLVGYGVVGLIVALALALGGSAVAYWKSDAIALAMSHARPADEVEYARLHNLVEGLCIAGGLPKPRLYVIEDAAPNAFATGRDPKHAAIAVTTGLLEKLNRIELEGVLAHELSHIKNYDILVSTLAVTLVGVIALLSDFAMRFLWWGGPRHRNDRRDGGGGAAGAVAILGFVLLLVTPLVARLMQFAVSRRRESLADVTGVSLTRYPPGLISALEKLRDDSTVVHSASRATAHLWIEAPTAQDASEGRLAWLNRLFNTHPPLDERIQALREL